MSQHTNKKTRVPVSFLVPVSVAAMAAVPLAVASFPVLVAESLMARLAAIAVAPITFSLTYVVTAAAITWPFQRSIIRGKFPRDVQHVVYGPRRMYGLGWGAVFYFTPIYFAFLSVPSLRTFLLRAFGYVGSAQANIAPDAWLRDLPMLNFSDGAYVANKATVGTNMCLSDGTILVDSVTLGAKSMVGHMALVAPGSVLGERAELGVNAALGVRAKVGAGSKIGPKCGIGHGARIGANVDVGTMSFVGVKAKIADGMRIPGGTTIPEGEEIRDADDLSRILNAESTLLQRELARLKLVYQSEHHATAAPAPVSAFSPRVVGGV